MKKEVLKVATAHLFVATSLDGLIAREDDALDWLPQEKLEGEDYGYETFLDSVDGLIMGRSTFETVLRFDSCPIQSRWSS